MFTLLGDWHAHEEASHPCDTEHSNVQVNTKWHPHGSCEDLERSVTQDHQHNTALDVGHFHGHTAITVSRNSLTPNDSHSEHCYDCFVALLMVNEMLTSTLLLI